MLLVIRATSVCHHLCGPVLEQRQRGLRASGATAHVCSQALSTSSHFCITSGPNWSILSPQPPLTPFLVSYFHSSTKRTHNRHPLSLIQQSRLKHTRRQRAPLKFFLIDAIISERDTFMQSRHTGYPIFAKSEGECHSNYSVVRRQAVLVEEWGCEQMHICGWERLGETD